MIKNTITFRERLPFGQFSKTVLNMASELSTEYQKNDRVITQLPIIKIEDWRKAAAWINEEKNRQIVVDELIFIVLSTKGKNEEFKLTENNVSRHEKRKWKSFDKFIESGSGLYWKVELSKDEWKSGSSCECPYFLKNFTCKHIIGLALQSKMCKLPRTAITTELGERPKRGRKEKSYKALLKQ